SPHAPPAAPELLQVRPRAWRGPRRTDPAPACRPGAEATGGQPTTGTSYAHEHHPRVERPARFSGPPPPLNRPPADGYDAVYSISN
ncbi:MAG TPA: hypothetical protein VN520_15325, partial [Streptomyces sp.]|nr:hypothetical protein [Streptomyces sp.]